MPAKTSPEPEVASVGGALQFITARPSGAAITVSAPFSTIMAPLSLAADRARLTLSPSKSKTRLNSPSCGVITYGRDALENKRSLLFSKTEIASASKISGRPCLKAANTRSRAETVTPSPGPIRTAPTLGSSITASNVPVSRTTRTTAPCKANRHIAAASLGTARLTIPTPARLAPAAASIAAPGISALPAITA